MKFLFAANPTVGHTNYLIELAAYFKSKGEFTHFILPGEKSIILRNLLKNPALTIDNKISKYQLEYTLMPMSVRQAFYGLQISSKKGIEETQFALKVFSAGFGKYLRALLSVIGTFKPDAIIYDYTFFPAIAASEKLQIPGVAVYHSGLPFFEYPVPPVGSNLKYGNYSREEFNRYEKILDGEESKIAGKISQLYGIKNIVYLKQPSSRFLNIVNSVRSAEYPRHLLPDTVHFTGPITPYENKLNYGKSSNGRKSVIYISLGTVFNKRPDLFRKIIESIDITDLEIVVAAGKSYDFLRGKQWKPNVNIQKFVHQAEVLQDASVFITHGGKNSINESMEAGVPMILFPAGGEQQYNADLAEWLGIGKNFGPIAESFTSGDLNSAIKELTESPGVQKQLSEIKNNFNNIDGAETAYKLILSKLQNRKKAGNSTEKICK
jgi:MGT family glycosyltransferase